MAELAHARVFDFYLAGQGGALQGDANGAPRWVHLDRSGADMHAILDELGVPELVAQNLVSARSRPRTMMVEDGVLMVLRGVNLNPGANPDDMVALRAWLRKDLLITVRQRRIMSVQDIRERIDKGQGPSSPVEALVDVIERLADRVADFVEDIDRRIGKLEVAVAGSHAQQLRPQIVTLRRQVAVVRRYLAPQRDALEALVRQADELLGREQSYVVIEQADRVIRAVEDLDLARERALVIQEDLLNQVAQQQNSRMYVLSLVTAIFLPITFLTGVFGMNVAGLPGVEYDGAFLFVALAMGGLIVLAIAVLKMGRWF